MKRWPFNLVAAVSLLPSPDLHGVCRPRGVESAQSSRPIRHPHVELDRLKLTLTEWVVREENPREGRYAVMLLCLCCHKIEHAGV